MVKPVSKVNLGNKSNLGQKLTWIYRETSVESKPELIVKPSEKVNRSSESNLTGLLT